LLTPSSGAVRGGPSRGGRSHPPARAPCGPPRPPRVGALRGGVTAPPVGVAPRRRAVAAAVAASAPLPRPTPPPSMRRRARHRPEGEGIARTCLEFGEVKDHVAKSPKCDTVSQTGCSQSYCHSVVTRTGGSARTYCFDHLVALCWLSPGEKNGSWATTPRPAALGYVPCT